ncbi:MAG: class I SAM-dependent methyltransferase [Candidatus Omnitrophica bacterium]|nr:class I SAM-dependent methyltransferase [Candidatus Omnitrophota bacterium]
MNKPDLEFTGEFLIPDKTSFIDWKDYQRHIFRYLFASEYVKDKLVLDLACGVGYGAYILSKRGAKKVIGGEIKSELLDYANFYYKGENRYFVSLDCLELPFRDKSFDIIVSFETIEHLLDVKKFLSESCRILKPDGAFICSTPNLFSRYTKEQIPPFHIHEFHLRELKALLQKHFYEILLFTQDYRSRPEYFLKLVNYFFDKLIITGVYRFLLKFASKERLKSLKEKTMVIFKLQGIHKNKKANNKLNIGKDEIGGYIYINNDVIKNFDPKYEVKKFKNKLMYIPYVFIAICRKPKGMNF